MLNKLIEYPALNILFYISIYIIVLSIIGFIIYVAIIYIHNKLFLLTNDYIVENILEEIDDFIHSNLKQEDEERYYTAQQFNNLRDRIERGYGRN